MLVVAAVGQPGEQTGRDLSCSGLLLIMGPDCCAAAAGGVSPQREHLLRLISNEEVKQVMRLCANGTFLTATLVFPQKRGG